MHVLNAEFLAGDEVIAACEYDRELVAVADTTPAGSGGTHRRSVQSYDAISRRRFSRWRRSVALVTSASASA